MKTITIAMNLHVSEYASRVLGVIKEKFGLKDKSEALEKFAEMFGEEFIEKEAKEEYVKKLLEIEKRHFEKYGRRKMNLKELDKLCEA
jgi:nitrogenase subunit NifH